MFWPEKRSRKKNWDGGELEASDQHPIAKDEEQNKIEIHKLTDDDSCEYISDEN